MSAEPGPPSAASAVAASFRRVAEDGREGIWIDLVDREVALELAGRVDARVEAGASRPLVGRTLAVKGNIDVAGFRTTAGCPTFGDVPAESAPAVRALERAGAVVVGTTNLDQFATGLVGTRSPHGPCPNAHWPDLISGGSSSGSAVAVAAGLVDLGMGTDTAGSGRVPAAINGIVGLKPTRGRVSTAGVVPACRSLDCVSIFARTVELAALAIDLAASHEGRTHAWDRSMTLRPVPSGRPWRLGVPSLTVADTDGDVAGIERFQRATELAVSSLGATAVPVGIDDFVAAGRLLYEGAFVAERYESVGEFVTSHLEEVDPVVGPMIAAAADIPAWRVFRDRGTLGELARRTEPVWKDVDVLVVPTVPRIPTVEEVAAEPISVNAMLGRFTNFVNLLDLCAITVPVGPSSSAGPPTSLTLIAPAWHDDVVIAAAQTITCGSRGTPAIPGTP